MEWIIGLLALRWLLPESEVDDDIEVGQVFAALATVFVLCVIAAPVLVWVAARDWGWDLLISSVWTATSLAVPLELGLAVAWWLAGAVALAEGVVALVMISRAAQRRIAAERADAFAEDDRYFNELS